MALKSTTTSFRRTVFLPVLRLSFSVILNLAETPPVLTRDYSQVSSLRQPVNTLALNVHSYFFFDLTVKWVEALPCDGPTDVGHL